MRTRTQLIATLFLLASHTLRLAHAQEANSQSTEATTKIEAFEATSGVVIVRGISRVGAIQGRFNSSITLQCKESTDASSGRKEYGIIVSVKTISDFERESISFIDYDEIESLLKGIEFILKIDKTTTKLDTFQADYKTRGSLIISTFSNSQGGIDATVQSGRFNAISASLSLADLEQFKKLIAKSKEMLDAIKK